MATKRKDYRGCLEGAADELDRLSEIEAEHIAHLKEHAAQAASLSRVSSQLDAALADGKVTERELADLKRTADKAEAELRAKGEALTTALADLKGRNAEVEMLKSQLAAAERSIDDWRRRFERLDTLRAKVRQDLDDAAAKAKVRD